MKPSNAEELAVRPGYYLDNDTWLYLSSTGELYVVDEPEAIKPVWRNVGLSVSIDAEPRTPDAEELALFERTRVSCGIPE
jgi:hypothetical protein